jgi:general secretion pathway protein F
MYYKVEYIKRGKLEETIIRANSAKEAVNKFKKKKLGILKSITPYNKTSVIEEMLKRFKLSKIDMQEYISVLEQFYVMLDAGLSIDMIVENIKNSIKNKKLKEIFDSIEKDIKAGLSLTFAFEKFSADLGKLSVAMVKLGEETGDLASAFNDLSLILHEILDNRKRLKKATSYPIFIIFAMSIAFVIVILFVIPPFKAIFMQLHTDLPLPTKFLLWIEHSLQTYGLYILSGAFFVFGVITYLYNTKENVKLELDRLILKMYIVGPIIKLAMIGRFVYVLQKLIDLGIPITDAVDMALNIVENTYIKKQLEHIRNSIKTGGTLKQGFAESGLFENIIVQMIGAGEESGSLVLMLEKISKYYFDKYKDIVDNIAVLIEPILIAAIAGFVMTLALGIFLPMWNLAEAMQ